jgi:hypothetical protein
MMQNLSKFLTEYIKVNLLDTGKFRDGEIFNAALERVLHEAIFAYRKKINAPEDGCIAVDNMEVLISAALLQVEKENPFTWVKTESPRKE